MGCDENNCRSCAKDDAADVATRDIEKIGESSEQLFYEVSVLDASVTPDQLRSELHDALDTLSSNPQAPHHRHETLNPKP